MFALNPFLAEAAKLFKLLLPQGFELCQFAALGLQVAGKVAKPLYQS